MVCALSSLALEKRKLTRVGLRSICVVIPSDFIADLGWKERQSVTLQKRGDIVIIRGPAKKKRRRR